MIIQRCVFYHNLRKRQKTNIIKNNRTGRCEHRPLQIRKGALRVAEHTFGTSSLRSVARVHRSSTGLPPYNKTDTQIGVCFVMERKTRFELATFTLAR